jgi:aryl-alcohol dehydrogenase-like predicted oxidoreductase
MVGIIWIELKNRSTNIDVSSVEEVMRALDDMIRAGKVLYVGISDALAWIVSMARALDIAVTPRGALRSGVLSGTLASIDNHRA